MTAAASLRGADRSVAELQPDGDQQAQSEADTQSASGEEGTRGKAGRIGQAGGRHYLHLLALLLVFHVGSQVCGTPLGQQILVKLPARYRYRE